MSAPTETESSSIAKTLAGGCLLVFLLSMVLVVAAIGLMSGAACVVTAERISQRQVEEVMVTSGQITHAGEREVQPGRVDITMQRRILGLVPFSTKRMADVVKADASSEANTVRSADGRALSSTYSTGRLILVPRDGIEVRSPEASHIVGTGPGRMAEQLTEFIEKSSAPRITLWWSSWLANLVGIPFALLLVVSLWMLLRDVLIALATKLGLLRPKPPRQPADRASHPR